VAIRNSETMFTENTIPTLEPEELFCEECSAEFTVTHDMGIQYIAHFCTFCGNEIINEDKEFDYEEPEND